MLSDELTAREELYEIARQLEWCDQEEKHYKELKEKVRPAFLDLITEVVVDEIPLATKVVQVDNDTKGELESWRLANYPDWLITDTVQNDDGWDVVLEEDPKLKKFEFVVDGKKFGRTVATPTPSFDAERFWEAEEDLRDDLIETVTVYKLNETKAAKLMAEKPEMKDIFEKYIKRSAPSVRLLPIRPVEEE